MPIRPPVPALLVLLLAASCGREPNAVVAPAAPPPVIPHEEAVHAEYAGSQSCRVCHEREFGEWVGSNHGLAERGWSAERDGAAFSPERTLVIAGVTSTVRRAASGPEIVTPGPAGPAQVFPAERAIGNHPLVQFLSPAPGGRWQATELAWDPVKTEWFNVYGDEGRHAGEWGHWTGRGMNWNTMCAACHNTRVRKNYVEATDSFRTTMAESTVSCESCHGPMKAHVRWRAANPGARPGTDPTVPRFSRDQVTDTCASCHSRRTEHTGDFFPGESYHDHHGLTVPDLSDLYYADGQVRDELYEYGSFHGSKMHAAGVRCVDCHNPHAAQPKLVGDAVCMQCHTPGINLATGARAPVIDPSRHTFHAPGSAGASCIGCHMPVTNYMQRDPRHDHGFTIPDPLLTREHGVPNACNRCHADQTVDWAVKHVDLWYGPRMNRDTRDRARLVALARRGDPAARDPLVDRLRTETNAYWRASTARLLEQWLAEPAVSTAVRNRTADAAPLVRQHAALALAAAAQSGRPEARTALEPLLRDPVRSVRVAAAWGLRDRVPLDSQAGRELRHSLDHNADQPAGQMQKGGLALSRGDRAGAIAHMRKAAAWDPYSASIRHDLAVALSLDGKPAEALAELQAAARLEPNNPDTAYSLALAWNEVGNLANATAWLEQATRLNPRHARAWYNLGLALHAQGRLEPALAALAKGEAADPADPALPYARATMLAPAGRREEAAAAARRALQLDPAHTGARQLLQSLGGG